MANNITEPQNAKTNWSLPIFKPASALTSGKTEANKWLFHFRGEEKNWKGSKKKAIQVFQPRLSPALPCDQCPRLFHFWLGLLNYVRFKYLGGWTKLGHVWCQWRHSTWGKKRLNITTVWTENINLIFIILVSWFMALLDIIWWIVILEISLLLLLPSHMTD